MNTAIIIAVVAACFIPLIALFICLKILIKEFKTLTGLIAILLGLLAVIPIAAIQFFISNSNFTAASLGAILLQAILFNGLIEESIKMAFIFLLPAKKTNPASFFSYSLLLGLSLACFETVIYLISGFLKIELRILTAAIIHASCSGLAGLFVYTIKKHIAPKQIMAFIIAVLLHGIYNYLAAFPKTSFIHYFSIPVIICAIVECRIHYRAVKEDCEQNKSDIL